MTMKKSIFIIFLLIGILLPIPLVRASPGWLPGWGKRVKFTFNYTDIDEVLTNFTGLIHLSNSSAGENDEDLSFVFDEVGASYLKIAVTTDDGVTEIYVDVEHWDATLEIAYLHAGQHPSLSNVTGTDGYLYYDDTHTNNTNYVGLSGSVPAEKAWDDNYVMVQHMRDNTTSSTLDSTSNDNDGTKTAANQPIVTTSGMIDDAQDFGGNDEVDAGDINELDGASQFTISMWMKTQTHGVSRGPIEKGLDTNNRINMQFVNADDPVKLYVVMAHNGNAYGKSDNVVISTGTWYHVVFVYDGSGSTDPDKLKLYIDGAEEPLTHTGTIQSTTDDNSAPVRIGRIDGGGPNGIIDEVSISNISRSAAWIKASYESGRDHLFDFGSEMLSTMYLTVYFHTGVDSVYTNGTLRANGTEVAYASGLVANVTSVVESGYLFLKHIYDSTQTLDNPVFLTIGANYTCSAYAYEEPGGWNVLTLVAIFLVGVILIVVKKR